MLSRRRHRLALVALLLLVCSVAVVAQEFAPHTDDGCQVEVHCLTCRHALGATATLTLGTATLLQLAGVVAAAVDAPARELVRPHPALPARAPPATVQA